MQHEKRTRGLVLELIRQGLTVRAISRALRGNVERSTIQHWKSDLTQSHSADFVKNGGQRDKPL